MKSECWVIVYHGDNLAQSYLTSKAYLPMYPEQISDTQQAIWGSQNIIGRSNPIAAYTGTDVRRINFSFDLHREMFGSSVNDTEKIDNIIRIIRSALYPKYNAVGLVPPRIRVVFGDLAVDGALSDYNYEWKKPIIDRKYQLCTVSLSIYGYATKIRSANELGSAYNPEGISTNY